MFEYKSEVIKIHIDMIYGKSKNHESEIAKFNEIVNQRANDGWELVCHSFTGLQDLASTTILLTFRKQKD